jgi:broad specificity phosphatase PhoE/peptidase E
MKVFLVRHGETESNRKRIIQGSIDEGLSRKGIKQAECLANRLKDEKIDLIISSEYKRALETAGKIKSQNPSANLILKKDLGERDYGIFNGRHVSQVDKFHPSVETKENMTERAKRIVDYITNQDIENIAVVSHGSIGKILINLLIGEEKLSNENLSFLKNGSLSIFELNKSENRSLMLNSVEHLEKEIVFIGGGDYREKETLEIDKIIAERVGKSGRMVFLPFAVEEISKREKRFLAVKAVYESLGLSNFICLNEKDMDIQEMKAEIKDSDILFILGGDPKMLVDQVNSLELSEDIRNYKGILIGFSAGAMILSKTIIIPGGVDKNYPGSITYPGLGMVPFSIIPHYSKELRSGVLGLLGEGEAYGVCDSSAIFFDPLTEDLSKIGEVYKL